MNNIGEVIAIFAIMAVLRMTQGILNRRDLNRWRIAQDFLREHRLTHKAILAKVTQYHLQAESIKAEEHSIIDSGTDARRESIDQRINDFKSEVLYFEENIQLVIQGTRVYLRALSPKDVESVSKERKEWQKLSAELLAIPTQLAALQVTSVNAEQSS